MIADIVRDTVEAFPVDRIPEPKSLRDPAVMEVVLSVFAGLGYALSARALLLLSLIGAFALAWFAMSKGGALPLVTLAVYAAFTVVPVTVLELRKRAA